MSALLIRTEIEREVQMETKLIKHEDGWAVPIDATLLDQTEIGPDTTLKVRVNGQELVITATNSSSAARVQEASTKVNQKYSEVFRKLAD